MDDHTAFFAVPGHVVRRLGPADAGEIEHLQLRCADFIRLVEGRDPANGDGLALLADRPRSVAAENKLVFGVFENRALMALVEVLRDYPKTSIWYVGLLLIDPDRRRSGIGASIYRGFAMWVRAQGATAIRLIVQRQNPEALRFWLRLGFRITGTLEQKTSHRTNAVDSLEHTL